jgi:hypothetical protein
LGDLAQLVERQIPLATLHPADVAAINIALESQALLGELLKLPHFADSLSQHLKWNWLSWHEHDDAQNEDYSSTDYVAQNQNQGFPSARL